jgi:hypothetical protein
MNKRELQKSLGEPYNRENWKQIVQFVFPNVELLPTPQEITIKHDGIVRGYNLGKVRLKDGKYLFLYELKTNDSVNIQRNRVSLNKAVSDFIDLQQIHGILAVFEQGNDDYRFMFSAKSTEFDEDQGDFINKKTDTKRFTYVLGKNESCKTPADRFFALSENKADANIATVQDAFSVERLSKEFFDKYQDQFKKFWKYIAANDAYKGLFIADTPEKRELQIRDFTKKLLGRIVFLHFLQKKGWMGCPPEQSDWQNGDKRFMQNLFADCTDKATFHSNYLHQLFYKTLNRKRTNDIFECKGLTDAYANIKIPYLNGGLFDSDETESKRIDFPETYFAELLEFFGQYNFTIDENDPNDHEVGIDPEMLGHIFENLLEDNKDKGAFYTPKIIVQYMCQESLIEYLSTKLSAEPDSETRTAIEELIREQLAEKCSDLDIIREIAEALYNVKICDPAIGSGAFPMGILNVIYQTVQHLHFKQPDPVGDVWKISTTDWQPHLVKKNIIQHSIYGVDIESGAVDIARLRFWLALVVDETEPLPLPNLDYKIMQGNSLLESFEGIDLSQLNNAAAYEAKYETQQFNMFSGERKKKVEISFNFDDIKTLMDNYFLATNPDDKKELHKRIDKQVLSHITRTLSVHQKKVLKEATIVDKRLKATEAMAKTWEQKERIRTSSKDAKLLASLRKELDSYEQKEIKMARLSNSDERPFFLWHLFFQEIFEAGGFDIVIGNPPYIKEHTNKQVFDGLRSSKYFTGKMDIWHFFACFCLDILKEEGGIQCFIAQNNWVTSAGSKIMRNKVLIDAEVLTFVDFGNYKVFQNAGIQTMIYLLKKVKQPAQSYYTQHFKLLNDTISETILKYFLQPKILNENFQKINFEFIPNSYLNSYITFAADDTLYVLEKITKNHYQTLLTTEVASGIDFTQDFVSKASSDKLNGSFNVGDGIFALNDFELERLNLSDTEKALIKPYFTPTELKRFFGNSHNSKWLIYTDSSFRDTKKMEAFPKLKAHLNQFASIITSANKPYGLHRSRNESFFKENKILSLRKCVGRPVFTYTNFTSYVSRPFLIIKSNRFDLKFLTGLFNSKLVAFWLLHKGKMQGDNYQVDKEPLLNIPIIKTPHEFAFAILVDYILLVHQNIADNVAIMGNYTAIINFIEQVIDQSVYELYFGNEPEMEELKILQFLQNLSPLSGTNIENDLTIVENFYIEFSSENSPVRIIIEKANAVSKRLIGVINESINNSSFQK